MTETARLDEIAEVRLGRQRSPKNHQGEQMVPYLRAANVTWGGLALDDVKTMNFTDEEIKIYELHDGDIVLSEASGSAKEVGKPAVWRSHLPGPVCLQNTLIRVRPNLDKVDIDWLYFRLLHECVRGGFVEASRGVGIHHLGSTKLGALSVNLPPVDAQIRRAARLREQLTEQARLQSQVRGAARLVLATKTAALAGLYEGAHALAPVQEVGELAAVVGGLQKQPTRAVTAADQGWPYLRVANVGTRNLDLQEVHRIRVTDAERDRAALRSGDLLVVEGNGSPDQIGRAARWDGSLDPCTHQNHLIRVRPGESLNPRFLELIWSSPQVRTQLADVASTTSGLYTLNLRKVSGIMIPAPEVAIQAELTEACEKQLHLLDALALGLSAVKQRATALRRSLLQAAYDPEDGNVE